MLDVKRLRKNLKEIETLLKAKDPSIDLSHFAALDERIRELTVEVEHLKNARNQLSKEIGQLKQSGKEASELMDQATALTDRVKTLDQELKTHEDDLHDKLATLPNIPLPEVKVAASPDDNVLIGSWREKPHFSFTPKHHLELNETLGLFDFVRGAKISGTGWPVYSGIGARLEWALLQYMMGHHIKKGFTPYLLPHCVRPEVMFGAGQLPKFENQAYKIHDDDYHLYLVPTAEIALNGLYFDEIIPADELPKKLVSYTPCFRREAGAAGASERGLIRIHQFNKVEMFCFAKPEESEGLLADMVESAEELLQGLELHYRKMLLVTGDTGFQAAKTIDIEVWLPGQDRYYEVSSLSTCTDFQARRSKIRYKEKDQKPELVHTLNGSGLATSRLMVALLENNQRADGTVAIPRVLQPYLDGLEVLG